MSKSRPNKDSEAFGHRLVETLASNGQLRRGAGAYLHRRYGVAVVTANAWLNGEHKPEISLARRIAEDHGTTFDFLYFGQTAEPINKVDPGIPLAHLDATFMPPQPLGIDPEILADSIKLLRAVDSILGEPPEASIDPYRLAVAYQAVVEEGGAVSDSNVIDFYARLAEKLRG